MKEFSQFVLKTGPVVTRFEKVSKISGHFLTFRSFWNILGREVIGSLKSAHHPFKLQFLDRNVHPSYTKEPLQKGLGSTEINAGDATVTPEHAIHGGRNLLPVALCVRVEGCLVFCNVAHPATDKPYTLRRNGSWACSDTFDNSCSVDPTAIVILYIFLSSRFVFDCIWSGSILKNQSAKLQQQKLEKSPNQQNMHGIIYRCWL